MFAVPGWSVAASSLKTQIEPGVQKSPVSTDSANGRSGEPQSPKKLGKRKRSQDKSTSANGITSDSLSDLWEKVVVGKPGKQEARDGIGPTKRRKKQRKREGTGQPSQTDQGDANDISQDKSQTAPTKAGDPKNLPLKEKWRSKTVPLETPNKTSIQAHAPVTNTANSTHLTPLQASMRQKLMSARFRHLNQTLYTTPSSNSLRLFGENPELFNEYHEGFRRQVEMWPENPVDGYVRALKGRGRKQFRHRIGNTNSDINDSPLGEGRRGEEYLPLPRTEGVCTVADLGCGDAKLAKAMESIKEKLKVNVISYDLSSPSKLVIRADIARLPLKDGSVNIAILCLALMGTNWIDFIEEAWRVLRWKGELWVAEIKSRFSRIGRKGPDHSIENRNTPAKAKNGRDAANDGTELVTGGEMRESVRPETDVTSFVEVLRKRGFILQNGKAVDMSNKMFAKLNFVKALSPVTGKCGPTQKEGVREDFRKQRKKFIDNDEKADVDESAVLKPCVYKIR